MTEKVYNRVVIVDDTNQVIGAEYLFDAIKKGCVRRTVAVFVFNTAGELLVQKRSASVNFPLLLDKSAAGHVDEGEEYIAAAARELKEELGIDGVSLIAVGEPVRTLHSFDALYILQLREATGINFNEEEIAEISWWEASSLSQAMKDRPVEFSPSFIELWAKNSERIIASVSEA